MRKYELYNEWRKINVIGADLQDALMRRKTLQSPDTYADGRKVADGEIHTMTRVHHVGPAPYTRGSDKVERAIVEFADGRIREIDARLDEEIDCTLEPLKLGAQIEADAEERQLAADCAVATGKP